MKNSLPTSYVSFIPPIFIFCPRINISERVFQSFSKFELENFWKTHSKVLYTGKNEKISGRKEI
jgi:hypothetical protein